MRALHEGPTSSHAAVQQAGLPGSPRRGAPGLPNTTPRHGTCRPIGAGYTGPMPNPDAPTVAFIGGGNMATALIGGLVQSGRPAASVLVIDPADSQRAALESRYGVRTAGAAGAELDGAGLVVWAVKPQLFAEAAVP
jgi:NADP oxidoreductase coenzyme F420-dependent